MSNGKKKVNGADNTKDVGDSNHTIDPGEEKTSSTYGNTNVSDKVNVTNQAGNNGQSKGNGNGNGPNPNQSLREKIRKRQQENALKREIVNSKEFLGEGIIMNLNLNKFNPEANTKYGICPQYIFTHEGYPNVERIWNAKSLSAQGAILPLTDEALAAEKTYLKVKVWITNETGQDRDNRYHVKRLN